MAQITEKRLKISVMSLVIPKNGKVKVSRIDLYSRNLTSVPIPDSRWDIMVPEFKSDESQDKKRSND